MPIINIVVTAQNILYFQYMINGVTVMMFLILFTFLCSLVLYPQPVSAAIENSYSENLYNIKTKQDLLSLMLAYPEYIVNVEKDCNEKIYIVMKSGRKILYDDRKTKNNEQKLANPDLQDMLEQLYPMSDIAFLLEEDCDPGRIRVYPLLMEVYGPSKGSIQSNLINVKVGSKNCQFNKNNNAADSLKAVMREMSPLIRSNPEIAGFVFPSSGTFNYRVVAGTGRLSPHSFGIAIDLKSDKKDYWKWTPRTDGQKRLDVYPKELVSLFEKHDFIWGGKWGHFDILHFEYRPELTIKGRYFAKEPDESKPWYEGVHHEDIIISEYIKIIDSALGRQ